ncbi:MAG: RNA methyltransferase [Firmicutes bacterium]|jgi:TrmH family RNA methyltransferase|nr:RNA methyltransferase [Bacillota bacterium]
MNVIASARNAAAREYRLVAQKGVSGKVALEGARLVRDAIEARVQILGLYLTESFARSAAGGEILSLARAAGMGATLITERVADSMTQTKTPQGVFAVARWAPLSEQDLLRLQFHTLVALDGVGDPGNVGTIIRTSAALGVGGVVLGPGCASPSNPKVVRASMGAMFRIPVSELRDLSGFLARVRRLGMAVVVSDPESGVPPDQIQFGERAVLVIGAEARGVSDPVAHLATAQVRIPMAHDVESLNAGAAAAILIYEAVRNIGAH